MTISVISSAQEVLMDNFGPCALCGESSPVGVISGTRVGVVVRPPHRYGENDLGWYLSVELGDVALGHWSGEEPGIPVRSGWSWGQKVIITYTLQPVNESDGEDRGC